VRAAGVAPLRVLGIDPGTLRLGYGLVEQVGSKGSSATSSGRHLRLLPRPRPAVRWPRSRGLRDILTSRHPTLSPWEEAFFGKNVQSTLRWARRAACAVRRWRWLNVCGYAPAKVSWRSHGRATKDQTLPRARAPSLRHARVDAVDALAIAISTRAAAGCDRRGASCDNDGRRPSSSR
jgi:crossover junction endodeoxyribonuclease RuvC